MAELNYRWEITVEHADNGDWQWTRFDGTCHEMLFEALRFAIEKGARAHHVERLLKLPSGNVE